MAPGWVASVLQPSSSPLGTVEQAELGDESEKTAPNLAATHKVIEAQGKRVRTLELQVVHCLDSIGRLEAQITAMAPPPDLTPQ